MVSLVYLRFGCWWGNAFLCFSIYIFAVLIYGFFHFVCHLKAVVALQSRRWVITKKLIIRQFNFLNLNVLFHGCPLFSHRQLILGNNPNTTLNLLKHLLSLLFIPSLISLRCKQYSINTVTVPVSAIGKIKQLTAKLNINYFSA